MSDNSSDIDIEAGIPTHAVSIVGDATDEFPVLKAFQQYIDAEQNKARKRMLSLCIFFGCLMTLVIVVFLVLLNGVNMRNQALSDRLIEYVMKDRQSSAVVVQQPVNDHSTMLLTQKIDEMQKKLEEAQQKALAIETARKEESAKAATEAAVAAAKEKARIKEELEVARLKAELAAEREKAAQEREKKRQEELEAYRRKQYPEFYAKKTEKPKKPVATKTVSDDEAKVDREIDELLGELNDADAIRYFDEEEEEEQPVKKEAKTTPPPPSPKSGGYTIPVEVKGKRSQWLIPN